VDSRGRNSATRGLPVAQALCTFLFVFARVAAVLPQASFPYQDLAADLAARIASAIPAAAQVSIDSAPEHQPDDLAPLRADVSARLIVRGARVVGAADGVMAIRLECLQNRRERSCTAEIRSRAARDIVMVTRAHDGRPRANMGDSLSLDLRPLFAQRAPLLDVAIVGDRLLVLDVESLSLYQRMAGKWQPLESRPLAVSRAWPRDPRGRLRVEGDRVEAWLPGVACTGAVAPLTVTCAERQRSWPIGIENGGLDAARNHFTTPEGLAYYSAAPLGAAAGARWLVADRDGALTWLDDASRPLGNAAVGDDVAALASACDADSTVVAVERAPGADGDALQMFQAVTRRLVSVARPITLAGTVTALWSTPGADAATVIVHDAGAARYEVFQISIACGR
jgi:hypothetical protein